MTVEMLDCGAVMVGEEFESKLAKVPVRKNTLTNAVERMGHRLYTCVQHHFKSKLGEYSKAIHKSYQNETIQSDPNYPCWDKTYSQAFSFTNIS